MLSTDPSSSTTRIHRSTSSQNANAQASFCQNGMNGSSVEQPQEMTDRPDDPKTFGELLVQTTHHTTRPKPSCCPPSIDTGLRLKWGLTLLGKERAEQYLEWLQAKLHGRTTP